MSLTINNESFTITNNGKSFEILKDNASLDRNSERVYMNGFWWDLEKATADGYASLDDLYNTLRDKIDHRYAGGGGGEVDLATLIEACPNVDTETLNGSETFPILKGDTVYELSLGTFADLVGGGDGIPEAPTDGQLYGRQNSNWAIVSSGETPTLDNVCQEGNSSSTTIIVDGGNPADGYLTNGFEYRKDYLRRIFLGSPNDDDLPGFNLGSGNNLFGLIYLQNNDYCGATIRQHDGDIGDLAYFLPKRKDETETEVTFVKAINDSVADAFGNIDILPIVGYTGTATLVSGTVTVATDKVKTGYKIYVSVNTPSGTQGFLSAPTGSIVDGTEFVINSTSATDDSTVNWWIAP